MTLKEFLTGLFSKLKINGLPIFNNSEEKQSSKNTIIKGTN